MMWMGVASFFEIVAIVLLLCDTARGQMQFTIDESNETVIVGSVTAAGSNLR